MEANPALDLEGIDGKAQDLTVPMYAAYGVEGLSASIQMGKKGELANLDFKKYDV